MRSIAYGIAILAAAGIMFFIAMNPAEPPADASGPETSPASVATIEKQVPSDAETQSASVTLNVPEMHCPFACYPSVKENLEKRDDVIEVALAPQKEEGVIDNPQVIVTYKQGFSTDAAIATLESAGFGGSTVVQ
ncbi:heavy-metal-associated domain-containing protein [Roseiconus nitratireducens]|uniref:Heavy-metal-associated domain-containing protein n=1 Tax=Roseiconus nitratireducens TaxID=2605748 RepID=A0A5M6D061_9BACT|nr:heavy metal-associated domain-containing protein [Roseiconus nitratireducens]KAA5540496.1 heavy-metal-associated domain-containing protein [Roseiconus nitratireducens]